jgi:PH/SEC7 domain-containing protein
MRAHDYHKKSSVVRVTTADWHVFLLQATDVTDMQQWIGAINKAAALYSSPPLAAPIGSRSGFHRPTFPLAPTRNNQDQQIESHEVKVKSLEKEVKEHQAKKPTGKNAKHGYLEVSLYIWQGVHLYAHFTCIVLCNMVCMYMYMGF